MASASSNSQRNNSKSELPKFTELYALGTALSFNLIFVDLQKVVCDALKDTFPSKALTSEIQIFQSKFEEYLESNDIDCIVSSSNAFGLMDHGFDRSVCAVLNDANNEIKSRVQQEIINKYYGEQPVGTCIIIQTGNKKIKYLAHSPTRRVNYSIKATDNIYLTMKAICNEIRLWNDNNSNDKQIENVLLTGLGTFYGAVSPQESARQTVIGWLLARLPKPKISHINWEFAMERQELIGYGGFHHFIEFINKHKCNSLTKTQIKILANALPTSVISKLHIENQCLSPNSKAQRDGQEEKVDVDTEKKSECQIM